MRTVILVVAAVAAARAGTNEWTGIGPDSGHITALAINPQDPQILFAGTFNGVFRTSDGGATWTRSNSGLPDDPSPFNQNIVTSFAIDPRNSGTAYAGIHGQLIVLCDGGCNIPVPGGIFKTTDGGATWKPVNSGLEAVLFNAALTIDPRNPDTLYAATYYNITDQPGCTQRQPCVRTAVFKSTDGAAGWAPASSGIPEADNPVNSLAIDPQDSGTLYASTGAGVFKTTDGGSSWSPVFSSAVPFVWVDPHNSKTLFAATAKALFKSSDGGSTWSDPLPAPPALFSLAADAQDRGILYGSNGTIFKSTDGGTSWSPAARDFPPSRLALVADPRTPGTIYAGMDGRGVFKSTDGAGSWKAANSGLRQTAVGALAVDGRNPGTIYAATNLGMMKTTDGGKNWGNANSGLPSSPEGSIISIASDPANPGVVYAVNNGHLKFSAQPGGIFKSIDGGATWTAAISGLESVDYIAGALLIDPRNRSTMYVSAVESSGYNFAIYRSTDGAGSWNRVGNGRDLRAVDPQNADTLYAYGQLSYASISKSTDGGASWSEFPLPMEALPYDDDDFWRPVTSVAVDPQNSSTVYIAGSGGIFKSTDGGASWTSLNSGWNSSVCQQDCYEPHYVALLTIDPQNPLNLYALSHMCTFSSCGPMILLRSIDGGTTWSAVNQDLSPFVSFGSVAVDPSLPGTVYAGSSDGVYVTTFAP